MAGVLDQPVHRTVVGMDVAGSGVRDDHLLLVMRADLREIVAGCLARHRIDPSMVDQEDQGDGLRLIVSGEVPPGLLIDQLMSSLAQALRLHRRTAAESARIRLRVAVHMGLLRRDNGVWAGTPLVHCARLLDAAQLRRVLRSAPEVDLAVAVSQTIYDAVVRPGLGADPATFLRVVVREKETAAPAWIHVPGHRVPPGLEGVEDASLLVRIRRWATVGRRYLVAPLLVFALVTIGLISSRPGADTADMVRELVCGNAGASVILQNHHSRLYLGGDDRPRLAASRSAVVTSTASANSSDCRVNLHPSAERAGDCMTAKEPTGLVSWSRCDSSATQAWIVEQHWRSEYYEWWEHLHPLNQPQACLQPSSTSGVGTTLTIAACSDAWLQQWRLLTD
jgi:hypothetical protein